MFKRILVAVDASETGDLALQTAIRLAVDWQANLRIVHAVDIANINVGEFFDRTSLAKDIIGNGRDVLSAAEAAASTEGLVFEAHLITIKALAQSISEAIASDAEAWAADLIVIGTHGRRGLSRLFIGSVAEGVARAASMPVLLVRGP
jgi:nucleotide-binding universal stress UspA family protein